ncbi:MAG: DUF3667 domain-containing protein [Flavobacteriaceae bacterium]
MKCKNCDSDFQGAFCNNCGQRKTANDRLAFRNLIENFLNDQFNIQKGFLYTLKYLAKKPGEVGKMYVEGKRKRFTSPSKFLIIAAALQALIDFLSEKDRLIREYHYNYYPNISEEFSSSIEYWNLNLGTEYALSSTILFIVFIPLVLNTFFRRADYNYTELMVVSFYFNGIALIINTLIVFIFRHIFAVYLPIEVWTLIYMAVLIWAFMSFYKHIALIPRFFKILASLGIIVLIRVYLLPVLFAIIFPV